MPVQERVIPLLLDKRDVVVESRTGSGKTAAFALPLCRLVDPQRDHVQGLILVPTRELADQVHGVVKELICDSGIRSVAVYGGSAYGPQIEAFKQKVHIIVATPGRMIDHLEAGRVSLKRLRCFVLDEADEMLSMGFYKSMVKILNFVPEKRITALFSATISPGVANLARRFTRSPEPVSLSGDIQHVEEVDHVYYVVNPMYKDRALLKIIEMDNLESALIFCNTKREVEYLGVFFQNFGYDGDFISSDLSQAERTRVMTRVRAGQLRFLVATDVAARGIDISDLGYVILYNLPQAQEHYIHRAGRTGRAGESGIAISLVSIIEEIELKKRAERHGIKLIKKELPTEEELEKKVALRVRVMLEERYRNMSNLEKERLRRFFPLARSMADAHNGEEIAGQSVEGDDAGETEAIRIMAMLFDQFYQETLHKPLYPREAAAPVQNSRPERSPRRGGGGRSRREGPRSKTSRPRSSKKKSPPRDRRKKTQ